MSKKQKTSNDEEESTKRKKSRWSNLSYATRMTLAFAFIAALTALVAIGMLSFVWDRHFKTYTTENIQTVATQTAREVAKGYEESRSWLSEKTTNPAWYASTYYNTRVQIFKADNGNGETVGGSDAPIWDSALADFGSNSGIPTLEAPSNSRTNIANIVITNEEGKTETIGYVRVWVYGTDTLLSKADEEFRSNSYEAMVFATIFAIILAMALGFLFARNLVKPINKMITTAESIKEGYMGARTNLTGDDEVARLGETFDAMADSIEQDRLLERRLTTDVAHELRTPLMAIQSTVEAMVDGVFEPDTERLETVNSEVERLSRLVDALLRLSRLENRNTPMNEEKVNVGELISGIVVTHEAFVIDSGLSMEFHTDKDVYVYGDADMIRQATANLISNAVRYTPEGGHITVRVKKGDIMASISVKDTGIGLTPEEKKMVFSRFWRADAGRNRAQGGLGVGLAVVKEIIDRHGGWVQVEGKPDQGATFTVHIPLYDEDTVRSRKNKEKKLRRG